MKILAIHNYHRSGSASGDDQVFKCEADLLQAHGHQVIKYTVSNDDFDRESMLGKLVSACGMFWSFKNYRAVKQICKDEQPDVVHIHTFFPLLSPSVLYAAQKCGCYVVATLHDTRFICPSATSLNKGELCNKCGDGHYFRMVKYGCFKKSKMQSFLVAMNFKIHRFFRSFYKKIDCYICLNEKQIELLTNIGFEDNKIVKKYNFVSEANINYNDIKIEGLPERYVVYFGRLGEEKGVRILMQMWDSISEIPLVVMGSGPLEDEFLDWKQGKENVYFLGYTEHNKCLAIVKGAEFVIAPSICYEGCSMVFIESESLGKALVATDLGFSEEAINNGINGYKNPLGDVQSFISCVQNLWENPALCKEMGEFARADYVRKYMPEDNYQRLIEIYQRRLKKNVI